MVRICARPAIAMGSVRFLLLLIIVSVLALVIPGATTFMYTIYRTMLAIQLLVLQTAAVLAR